MLLFKGCVPKIMSFAYKLTKSKGADEIVQKTAQNGAKLSVCLETHKFCVVHGRATLCLFFIKLKSFKVVAVSNLCRMHMQL